METTCGIFLFNTLSQRILIGHATRSRNLWSVPKGLKDHPEEDGLDAAFRELYEETNIRRESLSVLGIYPLPPQKYLKQNKVLESFLVLTDTDPETLELRCNSLVSNSFPEIDRFKWADVDEFSQLAHETQVRNLGEIKRILNLKV